MWTDDQWRWAEALQIEKTKGPEAQTYVAERIVALRAAGDRAGVERFTAIKKRLDLLANGATQ